MILNEVFWLYKRHCIGCYWHGHSSGNLPMTFRNLQKKKWDLWIIYCAGFWNYHFWDYITSSILGVLLLWIVLSCQSIFSSHTLCSRFSLKFSPPVECCLTTLGELSHSYKPCSIYWLTCKSHQLYSTKYILHCHLVLFDFHHLYLVSRSIRNSKKATS